MTAMILGVRVPELWAGVECTVNRVRDSYSDQLERSGHALRIKDLARLAELGVRRLRYPILWERTAPSGLDSIDWSWPDERMDELQRLGLRPIVGLVHHGSGPRYTNLLDPEFPEKFAKRRAFNPGPRVRLGSLQHALVHCVVERRGSFMTPS